MWAVINFQPCLYGDEPHAHHSLRGADVAVQSQAVSPEYYFWSSIDGIQQSPEVEAGYAAPAS